MSVLNSLQWRITLIAVAFAVLLAAALTAAGGVMVHQQLVASMSARARLAAGELHTQLERLSQLGLRPEDVTGFDEQCANLLRRDPKLEFAGVFDVYGRRLFGAGEQRSTWSEHMRDAALPGDKTSGTGELLAVHGVYARDGRIAAYIVVAVSDEAIREETWRNVRYFVLVASLLILLGLALHQNFLRRMVTRPLRGLVSAIERIDPDDPQGSQVLPLTGRDDIGRLARAFANLLVRLGDARRALVTQNRKLEAVVQERTRQLQDANAALAEDIERRKGLEQELRELASTDPLTGLANRAFVMPYIERRLEHARRNRRMLAVLLLDLDGFKPVNDRFGHAAGDQILRAVAQRLCEGVRQSDVLARVGGDEFVAVFEGFDDLHQVEAFARKLQGCFGQPFALGEHSITLGVSIGAGVFPLDAADTSSLLAQADHAMYRAKASGGGFGFADAAAAPLNPS